jgi:hypothetical protein
MRGEQTKHIRYGHAHASNTGMPCRFATGVALADNRWRASSSHDPFFRREAASRGANKAKVDPSFAPFGHSAMCFVRTYLCLGSNAPFLATIHTTRSLIESHLPIVVIFNANWELGRRNSRAALAANRKHAPPQPERPINPMSESSRSRRL